MSVKVLVSSETDDRAGVDSVLSIPGVEIVSYDPNDAELTELQREAEILIPPYRGTHRAKWQVEALPHLRMVQLLSAGIDEWSGLMPAGVILASSRGAHAGPVSEWVISAILTQLRQWPALVRFQDEGVWAHRKFDADTLSGKRVLIVGAGSIGTAVAQRLAAFNATSTLVAGTARAGVHSAAELPQLIRGHGIVVIAAPLTPATNGMVNTSFLGSMDDGSMLVNVGRGQIVDTMALVMELKSGRLRAALDVMDPEPLPEGHPLWSCPGVILSPHSARTVPGTSNLCYLVAADQIRTFLSGGVPSNAA